MRLAALSLTLSFKFLPQLPAERTTHVSQQNRLEAFLIALFGTVLVSLECSVMEKEYAQERLGPPQDDFRWASWVCLECGHDENAEGLTLVDAPLHSALQVGR